MDMDSHSVPIFFVCKLCRRSFNEVIQFIGHKIEDHWSDYLNTKRIIFEERPVFDHKNSGIEFPEDVTFSPELEDEVSNDDDIEPLQINNSHWPISENKELFSIPSDRTAKSERPKHIKRLTREELAIKRKKYLENRDLNFQSNSIDTDNIFFEKKQVLVAVETSKQELEQDSEINYAPEPELVAEQIETENLTHFIYCANREMITTNFDSTTALSTELDYSTNFNIQEGHVETHIELPASNEKLTPGENKNHGRYNPYVLLSRLTSKEIEAFMTVKSNLDLISNQAVIVPHNIDYNFDPDSDENTNTCADNDENIIPESDNGSNYDPEPQTKQSARRKRVSKGKSIACDICGKLFRKTSVLNAHKKSHSTDKPFKCSYPNCTSSFKFKQSLQYHVKCHSNNPFKSIFRRNFFRFPSHDSDINEEDVNERKSFSDWLQKHKSKSSENIVLLDPDPSVEGNTVKTITPTNPICCKLCCSMLQSDLEAKIHVKHCWLENKSRHRYCVPCNKLFYKSDTLMKHSRNCSSNAKEKAANDTFKCKLCLKEFGSLGLLTQHEKVHKSKEEQRRPFSCHVCGSTFSKKRMLSFHLTSHLKDRPYKCSHPKCEKLFKSSQNMRSHMKIHSDSRPFNCSHQGCSKKFKTSGELRQHSFCHKGSRPRRQYKCTQENCNYFCVSGITLKRHVKIIHGIGKELPSFFCDICNKRFTSKNDLRKHYAVHSVDRPFKCNYEGCSASFKRKPVLAEHIEYIHKGKLQFQCEVCGKFFGRRPSMYRHKRLHDNKHVDCHLCPRKFPGSWELKQHLLVHEKGPQFVCQFCGKKCSRKENLKVHEQMHENQSKSGEVKRRKRKRKLDVKGPLSSGSETDENSDPSDCEEMEAKK